MVGQGHAASYGLSQARPLPEWQLLGRYQGSSWLVYTADRYRAPRVRVVVDFLLHIADSLGRKPAAG